MQVHHSLSAWILAVGIGFSCPAAAVTQQQADAFYASQDWAAASRAYAELVREDRTNANNLYNLGRSQHQNGDLSAARRSYEMALANNHPTPGRVRYHLARALMAMGHRGEALAEIQQLVGTGITHRQLLAATEFAPLREAPEFQAVVAQQTPCSTPQFRQFDFWLGQWNIVPWSAGAPAGGQNSITSAQDGCVVLENYTAGAATGMSINFYDAARGVWHQTWMGNGGGVLYLEGGINADGAMELSDRGLPGATAGTINRTIWTPLTEGGVRQHWQISQDEGATWNTVFDGRYMRRTGG